MKNKIFQLFLIFTVISGSALAASRRVTLAVQNMTCSVCPITVKKALEHVSGVQKVKVDYASRTATVEFDDSAVTVDQLIEATNSAGFPSSIKVNSQ